MKRFIWTNPNETLDNQIDDDGNGYVDDVHGWDVSDEDANVTPPAGRADFYHGTHIAGIVAQIAQLAYGDSASDLIQIMPVKSLSDAAQSTYLKDAFRGIEYAVRLGADIIICSWGVGHITPEQLQILNEADQKGILIVASAGNLPEEREQYPAAHQSVIAVAALDRKGQKIMRSNFGQFIDLSAPGLEIRSTSSESDDGYEIREGTSFSAPMVATAAALIKLQHPSYTRKEIEACLKSSADPIEASAARYDAKLGAGKLNIEAAVECNLLQGGAKEENRLRHPKGYLRPERQPATSVSWSVEPRGDFKGLRFDLVFNREKAARGSLVFRAGRSPDARVIATHSLGAIPATIYVPGTTAHVTFIPDDPGEGFDWLMAYEAETIDFSQLYCHGTKDIRVEGTITDGSGANDYSHDTDCKWLITAPKGKVIHFEFTDFETEGKRDLVYFFNGSAANETIMAIFSGSNIPPQLTSWRNEVLVWFVTDGQNQGNGWQAKYTFQDKPNPAAEGAP